MTQKLQPALTKVQQSKLDLLQLEVEALWSQVREKTALPPNSHTEVTDKEQSIATRDRQFHSI